MSRYSNKLIFLHIEKAGGSTLHHILSKYYDKKEVLHLDYMEEGQKEISQLDTSKLELIKGHNLFGTHHYLNDVFKYYSMLREPEERVKSYFYYVRQKEIHHHSKLIREKNWDLGSYILESKNLQMDNGQVRYISGSKKSFGEIDSSDLELAKENINQFFLTVGLTEKFDESMVILKNLLGWKEMPTYVKANVNRKKADTISDEHKKIIIDFNKYDYELYAFVKQRFLEDSSKINMTEEMSRFQKAMKKFHFNKKYSKDNIKRKFSTLFKKGGNK